MGRSCVRTAPSRARNLARPRHFRFIWPLDARRGVPVGGGPHNARRRRTGHGSCCRRRGVCRLQCPKTKTRQSQWPQLTCLMSQLRHETSSGRWWPCMLLPCCGSPHGGACGCLLRSARRGLIRSLGRTLTFLSNNNKSTPPFCFAEKAQVRAPHCCR